MPYPLHSRITASFNLQETYYHYFENGSPPPYIAFSIPKMRSIQYGDKSACTNCINVEYLDACGQGKIVIHISIFSVTVHQRTTFKNKKINPSTQVNTILKGRTQIYLSDDIAIFALS